MPRWTTVLLATLLLAERQRACANLSERYRQAHRPGSGGGVTDTMARIVAQRLTEAWGSRSSSITVQAAIMPSERKRWRNRRRMGSRSWSRRTPPSPPIRISSANSLRSGQGPHAHHRVVRITPVLVINSSLAVRSVGELIALAKAKPGS